MTVEPLFDFDDYEAGSVCNIYSYSDGVFFCSIRVNGKYYVLYYINNCSYLIGEISAKRLQDSTPIVVKQLFSTLYLLDNLYIVTFDKDYKSFKFSDCASSDLPNSEAVYDLTTGSLKTYKVGVGG